LPPAIVAQEDQFGAQTDGAQVVERAVQPAEVRYVVAIEVWRPRGARKRPSDVSGCGAQAPGSQMETHVAEALRPAPLDIRESPHPIESQVQVARVAEMEEWRAIGTGEGVQVVRVLTNEAMAPGRATEKSAGGG
jgi:hypothetical protein